MYLQQNNRLNCLLVQTSKDPQVTEQPQQRTWAVNTQSLFYLMCFSIICSPIITTLSTRPSAQPVQHQSSALWDPPPLDQSSTSLQGAGPLAGDPMLPRFRISWWHRAEPWCTAPWHDGSGLRTPGHAECPLLSEQSMGSKGVLDPAGLVTDLYKGNSRTAFQPNQWVPKVNPLLSLSKIKQLLLARM